MTRILIVAGNVRSLVANRGDLIARWASAGHRIKALVPAYDWNDAIEVLPLEWSTIPLVRVATNPVADYRAYRAIRREVRAWRPEVVFSYNAKPLVYGSLAARAEGVPRSYSMITGLGYYHDPGSLKLRLAARPQELLLRWLTATKAAATFHDPLVAAQDDLWRTIHARRRPNNRPQEWIAN